MTEQSTAMRTRREHPLSRPALQRHGRLALGVSGTLGGGVLLSTNITYLVLSGATTLPWIPLLANAALIFGGAMFLREYRRSPLTREGER